MGAIRQVFVDLAFQGRLRKSDELVGAEIFLFTQLLEEQGTALLDVPGYCVTVPVPASCGRKSDQIEILLKILGVWTPLWLEVRQPGIYILYDRWRREPARA
jgi:hypothetical protein